MNKLELHKLKLRLTAIRETLSEGLLSAETMQELYKEMFEIYVNLEVIPKANEMVDYGATFDNEVDLLALTSNRLFIDKYGMEGIC